MALTRSSNGIASSPFPPGPSSVRRASRKAESSVQVGDKGIWVSVTGDLKFEYTHSDGKYEVSLTASRSALSGASGGDGMCLRVVM